jgi:hypothetical protein
MNLNPPDLEFWEEVSQEQFDAFMAKTSTRRERYYGGESFHVFGPLYKSVAVRGDSSGDWNGRCFIRKEYLRPQDNPRDRRHFGTGIDYEAGICTLDWEDFAWKRQEDPETKRAEQEAIDKEMFIFTMGWGAGMMFAREAKATMEEYWRRQEGGNVVIDLPKTGS